MPAYLDCLACACLIRASEPSCPFCGASQRVVSAPSRLGLGLVLGLGLSLFGCVEEEGEEDTIADSQDADGVTYAGPDDPTHSTPGGTDTINDSQQADAVTYAGPDENTTLGDTTTDYGTTTSGGTTAGDGTTTSDADTQEADAVTYAGPDETDSTSGG